MNVSRIIETSKSYIGSENSSVIDFCSNPLKNFSAKFMFLDKDNHPSSKTLQIYSKMQAFKYVNKLYFDVNKFLTIDIQNICTRAKYLENVYLYSLKFSIVDARIQMGYTEKQWDFSFLYERNLQNLEIHYCAHLHRFENGDKLIEIAVPKFFASKNLKIHFNKNNLYILKYGHMIKYLFENMGNIVETLELTCPLTFLTNPVKIIFGKKIKKFVLNILENDADEIFELDGVTKNLEHLEITCMNWDNPNNLIFESLYFLSTSIDKDVNEYEDDEAPDMDKIVNRIKKYKTWFPNLLFFSIDGTSLNKDSFKLFCDNLAREFPNITLIFNNFNIRDLEYTFTIPVILKNIQYNINLSNSIFEMGVEIAYDKNINEPCCYELTLNNKTNIIYDKNTELLCRAPLKDIYYFMPKYAKHDEINFRFRNINQIPSLLLTKNFKNLDFDNNHVTITNPLVFPKCLVNLTLKLTGFNDLIKINDENFPLLSTISFSNVQCSIEKNLDIINLYRCGVMGNLKNCEIDHARLNKCTINNISKIYWISGLDIRKCNFIKTTDIVLNENLSQFVFNNNKSKSCSVVFKNGKFVHRKGGSMYISFTNNSLNIEGDIFLSCSSLASTSHINIEKHPKFKINLEDDMSFTNDGGTILIGDGITCKLSIFSYIYVFPEKMMYRTGDEGTGYNTRIPMGCIYKNVYIKSKNIIGKIKFINVKTFYIHLIEKILGKNSSFNDGGFDIFNEQCVEERENEIVYDIKRFQKDEEIPFKNNLLMRGAFSIHGTYYPCQIITTK